VNHNAPIFGFFMGFAFIGFMDAFAIPIKRFIEDIF
jgi:hypothetical protein